MAITETTNVRDWIKNHFLLFDGAMGTMFQRRGLAADSPPELLNLTNPDIVTEIHREYVRAGSDVVSANTFQANELKLPGDYNVEEIISAGVRCAKESGARFVALDVGPLGQLMEPAGTIGFQRAYEIFRRQVVAGEKAGADIILIETISDPYEAKAAILAAKENTNLPVFCTMTFQEDGRTFMGCDPLTATVILQGLGVDALGVNCSLGPEKLEPVLEVMLRYSRVPVIMQANAGLPVIRDGETVYDISHGEYAAQTLKMAERGVRIMGGCCGTTPEHIKLIKDGLDKMSPVNVRPQCVSVCASAHSTVILDGVTTEIGERLNPTGKKNMQAALRRGDMDYIIKEAIAQVEAGSAVLDVNAGLPDIDEPAVMSAVVRALQSVVTVPLQIDSADPAAIEAALRVYNGKAIINSVNGKQEIMERIFPLAKKYGALVVGLTLDENGIPSSARGRLEIARRIRDTANSYGIPDEDLLIDCLTLTASAQQEQVMGTLEAIRLVKSELNLKTVLGVSNVSFGLPQRETLNAAFLASALSAGLDAAILNPLSKSYREILDAYRVLSNEDKNAKAYISKYSCETNEKTDSPKQGHTIADIILQGRKDEARGVVKKLLHSMQPTEIIDKEFVPALNEAGKRYEAGEIFLPQLMQSAQAVQNGFAVIKEHMNAAGEQRRTRGKVLLATVSGDIHDIGKNIVALLLESYGFEVMDLGKDVPVHVIVDAIRENHIRLAGLSALMTTTVKSMKDTIDAVREAGLKCSFVVGGAVLNEEYVRLVGADYYAADAMDGVAIASRFFAENEA